MAWLERGNSASDHLAKVKAASARRFAMVVSAFGTRYLGSEVLIRSRLSPRADAVPQVAPRIRWRTAATIPNSGIPDSESKAQGLRPDSYLIQPCGEYIRILHREARLKTSGSQLPDYWCEWASASFSECRLEVARGRRKRNVVPSPSLDSNSTDP